MTSSTPSPSRLGRAGSHGGRPRQFDEDAVLEAAIEVFWTHGFEAASTEALVERTGLGRGSLYNAFGSKRCLYHEALGRYQVRGLAIQTELLRTPGPVRNGLRALLAWGIDQDLDPATSRPCMGLFSVLEQGGRDPVVADISRDYANRLEALLVERFAEGQRTGEFAPTRTPRAAARAFLASYYGLRVLGRGQPRRSFLDGIVETTLAAL